MAKTEMKGCEATSRGCAVGEDALKDSAFLSEQLVGVVTSCNVCQSAQLGARICL